MPAKIRLITGQNSASSEAAAVELLKQLGKQAPTQPGNCSSDTEGIWVLSLNIFTQIPPASEGQLSGWGGHEYSPLAQ
ncbi:hypothetical protein [uncultured Hymenobacter sp.]|uniref:hypothetical protein n=1 Tax=uncultured Hymenobacter sp. TaxID=170016 RepID=UPI0035CC239A